MNKKLKSQGDLDGACFLYALANSVICLTGRDVTPDQWSRGITSIRKSPGDFLRQDIGTLNYDLAPERIGNLAKRFLGASFQNAYEIERRSTDRLGVSKLIDERSVAVVGSKEHWYVLAELSSTYAYIACSDQLNAKRCSYREDLSPLYRRAYNQRRKLSEISLFGRMAFMISEA